MKACRGASAWSLVVHAALGVLTVAGFSYLLSGHQPADAAAHLTTSPGKTRTRRYGATGAWSTRSGRDRSGSPPMRSHLLGAMMSVGAGDLADVAGPWAGEW